MGILFVGNTAEDFGASWENSTAATGTARDTAYSPSACIFDAPADEANPGVINLGVAPTGDLWFHMRFRTSASAATGTTLDGHMLSFYAANGVLLARFDLQDGGWRAQVFGDTTVAGANFSPAASTVYTYDFKLVVGATIELEIYQNGSLVSSASAANTVGLKGVCRQIALEFFDIRSSGTSPFSVSEAIVTDGGESTIGWRLATLTPASAGAHSDWDGDYTNLLNALDGNFLFTDTVGDKESWVNSAYAGPGSPTSIRAVVAKLLSDRGGAGPQSVTPFLRIGGTDYDAATVAADFRYQQLGVWDVNPATSAAWATAALAALESGVKAAT